MIKLRKFVIPNCASDEDPQVADFFATFGIEQAETQEEETQTEETQTQTQEEETQTEDNSETQAKTEDSNATIPKPNKANEAFAQLRVENKKYQSMMQGIAQLLGVQSNDPNAILNNVQQAITQAQAKQQGVPPELLSRMAQLEEQNRGFMQNEIRKNAYLGFQSVKDKFSLDNNALNSFADTLVQEGLNPFEQQVDLETEYIRRNYSNLMKMAEERGAQKEAERAARARTQGTSPDNKQGGESNQGVEKINTISDLDKWFRTQSK